MICATLPIRRSLLRRIAAGSATLLTSIASAIPGDGGPFDEIGLTALLERLAPERVPTGAPFELFAINPTSTAGAYGPDQSHPELVPMDFVQWGGPPGIFDFVTDRTIELCGAETGIAPGLDAVWIKDWLAWFNSLTPNDAVAPPASHPTQVDIVSVNTPMTWGTAIGNNTALRKIDWLALSQEQLWVASAGANVGPTIQYPVAFCGYNTLAVGGSGGDHQHGTVPQDWTARVAGNPISSAR